MKIIIFYQITIFSGGCVWSSLSLNEYTDADDLETLDSMISVSTSSSLRAFIVTCAPFKMFDTSRIWLAHVPFLTMGAPSPC